MNKTDYLKKCNADLANDKFYKKLDKNPTKEYVQDIENCVHEMKNSKMISENEQVFLTEHLNNPTMPTFYGLPKIHKIFLKFPPLRPIVSNIDSCTRRLSEFLDSFLKYQARLCSSFIKDTKQFLQKIESLNKSTIPKESILVTMDVAALYTNIDHEEGAEACFEKLEQRKNKTITSKVLKSLILLVLKCNAFKFGSTLYQQVMGTCMGTPMAPNYANLFMDKFENNVIDSFRDKTGLVPLVWFRYIDDIFFLWTHGSEKLDEFVEHANKFSENNKMSSNIKFEVNISTTMVNFLDVSVTLEDGILKTNLYSKPTDAFLYLNKSSNHPKHVIDNIPKGQFIRIRRICSNKDDYFSNCGKLCSFFIKRGYENRTLQKTIKDVAQVERDTLLEDIISEKKDPQLIFVCNWHPNLSTLPVILKKHFHILENDIITSKIFPSKPIVAYRRAKSIKNYVVKNKVSPTETKPTTTKPCGKCKLCKNIWTCESVKNKKSNITFKINDGGTCQSKDLIYAARCKKHDLIYVGQTGEKLCTRFAKHRWDITDRPANNELADHFHKDHKLEDMEVTILQTGLSKSRMQREYFEDRWICKLQTLQDTGINKDTHQYAKDMYQCFARISDNNEKLDS